MHIIQASSKTPGHNQKKVSLQLEHPGLLQATAHLRVEVAVPNLLVQQLAHSALKLGADLLRLVADIEGGHVISTLHRSGQHAGGNTHEPNVMKMQGRRMWQTRVRLGGEQHLSLSHIRCLQVCRHAAGAFPRHQLCALLF